ncbi:MAG: phospholipid/cholesterol/gamma-HCH transport system substrate-binding protein [Nocardioidaceae bacterium]|nr:phospholipid/cholesterol/gamma-HCH transport system substrate-binding protein [Nocardioidaceae bacterium]
MRRSTKVRLLAFVLLSVVGVVYVGASYLGVANQVLGRGYTVHVLLPDSGGLYQGSDVTYRGVHIGKVTKMVVKGDGLRVDAAIDDGTRIPADSPIRIHNLSAVGEQYLDFEPGSKQGRQLKNGDTVRADKDSLPVGEDVLLTDLSRFVSSLDGSALNTVVSELGDMFRDNANPLRSMVNSTHEFIEAAQENEPETVALLDNAKTVLATQQDNAANIQSFARDLATITGTLAKSDADVRKILNRAGPSADELIKLVHTLRTVLPPFLTHFVSLSKVVDARLPALEQLLVTFPRLVASGPTALTPPDGKGQKFGRVNLNLNEAIPACTDGYLPPGQWRPTSEESFVPYYPAECKSGAPIDMRGMKYAPDPIALPKGLR